MIRIEVDGIVHGPFKALLDTGAQPTLISFTLFKRMRCSSNQSVKRLLGVGSQPLTIKRRMNVILRPWFESDAFLYDQMWILPHENTWKPLLPSTELQVHRKDHEFRQTLADPVYYEPKEVHILLGVGFVARILERKSGYEADGTAVFETMFGNVIMGEHTENWEELIANGEEFVRDGTERIMTVVDDTLGEKLNGMLERLWEMDKVGIESKRTVEEEMVEKHFIDTHFRDESGRFVVRIPLKQDTSGVGSSRKIALKRFGFTERKIHNSPDVKEFYIEQMREAIRIGHMVEVNRPPRPEWEYIVL